MLTPQQRSRIALATVGLLLAANIVVPIVWGDVYPFTSAPMFRDSPTECCNYQVYAADGRELPPDDWCVQRIYDGNPIGYGVGVCPPAVIEQEFGIEVAEEEISEANLGSLRSIARFVMRKQDALARV